MDARLLDMLHHTADKCGSRGVSKRVNIDLDGFFKEAIDENGALLRDPTFASQCTIGPIHPKQGVHSSAEASIVIDDLHCSATKDIARTHQRRIANLRRHGPGSFERRSGSAWGLSHPVMLEQVIEALAVLSEVDRRWRCPQHQVGGDVVRELEWRLPTKRDDHSDQFAAVNALALLDLDDGEDVLAGQRLEVETVRGVVVRTDGLRVAVHHDGLESRRPKGHRGMHAAVVELDSLSDPIGARTQDDDSLLVGGDDLVLLLIGTEVVGREGLELSGAGVHRLERGHDSLRDPTVEDLNLSAAEQVGQLRVGEPEALEPSQIGAGEPVECGTPDLLGRLSDQLDLRKEPRINQRGGMDCRHTETTPQCSRHHEDAVRGRVVCCHEQLVIAQPRPFVLRSHEAISALLKRTDGLLERLRERTPDRHDLAHRLHAGPKGRLRSGQLLERPAWDLGDDVVNRRLEARWGGLGDVIDDLVESVADGETSSDLGDREPRGLRGECART